MSDSHAIFSSAMMESIWIVVLVISVSLVPETSGNSTKKPIACKESFVRPCLKLHLDDTPTCTAVQNELNCFEGCDPYATVLSQIPYKRVIKILDNLQRNYNMCHDVVLPHTE